MKRFGIVGVGAIAQAYIKALDGADFGRVVAVTDIRPEAAKAAAEIAKAKAYESAEEMARDARLDAVIIATPPDSHPGIVETFLRAGIPVLCEKPFAITGEAARAMAKAGETHGRLVTMASKFRYVEDVIRLRAIVASGLLGDILLLENAFVSPVDMSGRWNSRPEISGGGVLIDNGTHSIDIVRYLLGPIAEVMAVVDTSASKLAVEDNVHLFARTTGGAKAHIDLSWSFDKQLSNYISVYGSAGTAHVGWKESKYKQRSSSDWIVFGKGYDKVQAFRANVENFCAALDGEAMPLITAQDAIASVDAVTAAYRSSLSGRWEAVVPAAAKPVRAVS